MQKIESIDALAVAFELHESVAKSVQRCDTLLAWGLDEEEDILIGANHRLLNANVKGGGIIVDPYLAKVGAGTAVL